MRLRLTKVSEYDFLLCLKYQVWGSRFNRFKDWKIGDLIAFIVDKEIAGLAEIKGEPYSSDQCYWENDFFPFLIPIRFTKLFLQGERLSFSSKIREAFISRYGKQYGWVILNKTIIDKEIADTIMNETQSLKNHLNEVQSKLDVYIEKAKCVEPLL